jgi:hypothetical protein
MSTRIENDFYFQTAVHFEGKFYINSFELTLSMLVETDCIREQNVAMDRATYFIMEMLQNSILINSNETQAIERYKDAGLKVCEIPEEPYDQIVAMVLLLKLNAIMEDRLQITDLVIGSTMSEGIRYNLVSEVAESVLSGSHWWTKPTVCLSNEDCVLSPDNVVKLFDDRDWKEIGLSWKEKAKKGKK